ncbi:MAG: cadherin-like domain-containing protein, partial [Candidatus Latescibacteria bacterium]|nr:cadherin-like domain-containing protein [Candidatus Latescibacterota bacterium]
MKRYIIGLLTLLAFAFTVPAGAFAQNSLDVASASGDPASSGNIVRVDMTNDESVSGIEFTLRAVSPDLEPTDVRLGTRFLGKDFSASSNLFAGGDSARVVIVSLSGDSIEAGTGTIAEILFDVAPGASPGSTTDMTLNDIVVSDPLGGLVDGTNSSGLFTIITTTPSTLSADNVGANLGDAEIVTVSLDNLDVGREVAALQFTLTDLPDNLDVVDGEGIEVTAVGRASGFSVGANETENGVVVTLTDAGGGTIVTGSGPIVEINYLASRGSGVSSLDFTDVTISDADAVEMPQGTHTSGSFAINVSPVAVDDEEEAEEDTPVSFNLLANDTDDDGDPLTITGVTQPDNGDVVIDVGDTSVTYTPDPDYNSEIEEEFDEFTYTISDGNGGTDVATVSVDVLADNDAPVVSAPETEVTDEDVALIFSDQNDNEITISDVDADEGDGGDLQVTLTASSTVTLNPGAEVQITDGADGSSTVTFTGGLSDINDALDGLTYQPDPDVNGIEEGSLIIDVIDAGGSFGNHSISIDITPVNDAPSIAGPSSESTDEDTPITFNGGNDNTITVHDLDADDEEGGVEVTLTATSTVTLNQAQVGDLTSLSGDGTDTVVMTGAVEEINDVLNGMVYTPDPDVHGDGAGSLTVDVSDLGNTGSGGPLADQLVVSIDITSINDVPSITSTELADALQDIAYSFTVTAEDAEGDDITFGLAVAPEWLSIDEATGQLSGIPAISDTGNAEVEIRVSDGEDSSSTVFGLDVIKDTVAPEFISGPSDQGVTDTQITVVFSSNEAVTGVVRYGIADQQNVPPSTNGTLALTDSVVIGTPDTEQS